MDEWLRDMEAASSAGRLIAVRLADRDKSTRNSAAFTKASTQIRLLLKRFAADIRRLSNELEKASRLYYLTSRELDRRQAMMDVLLTRQKQLEEALTNGFGGGNARSALLSKGGSSSSVENRFSLVDSSEYAGQSNEELKTTQKRMINTQDESLKGLASILTKQKDIAVTIGQEVNLQNEIIADVTETTTKTNKAVARETRNASRVVRKSATSALWVVIVVLLVAIIVVALPIW